jgi:hypothetical protein
MSNKPGNDGDRKPPRMSKAWIILPLLMWLVAALLSIAL